MSSSPAIYESGGVVDPRDLYAELPPAPGLIHAPGFWGVVLFILSEATLFASLLASYFYLRSGAAVWPLDGIEAPKLARPIAMTILLVGSSIPMFIADWSARKGNQGALRLGLGIAFIMGAAFIGLQAWEYSEEPFKLDQNAYTALFFTITGLHGIHVVSALVMNLYTQVRAWLGHFGPAHSLGVSVVSWYWHFVDLVWIALFICLYLTPHWF